MLTLCHGFIDESEGAELMSTQEAFRSNAPSSRI